LDFGSLILGESRTEEGCWRFVSLGRADDLKAGDSDLVMSVEAFALELGQGMSFKSLLYSREVS
jgi:hypothetical protein